MEKAYLLLIGANSCHDGDEFQGIYTDATALKEAYERLLQGRGIDYDSYLKPKIYEFDANTMDKRERLLSTEELNALVEEEKKQTDSIISTSMIQTLDDRALKWYRKHITQFHQECLQFEKCFQGDPEHVFHQHFNALEEMLSEELERRERHKQEGVHLTDLENGRKQDSRLKMWIGLDEARMVADGMDPRELWAKLQAMVEEIEGLTLSEEGLVVSESSGARSWFNEQLENTPWFMKYVTRWEIDDPTVKDDVIQAFREMGVKVGE